MEQEEEFDEENIPDVYAIELDKQSDYHLSVIKQLNEFSEVSENSSKVRPPIRIPAVQLTHLCPPLRFRNQVPTFAVRETASLGKMGEHRVPP